MPRQQALLRLGFQINLSCPVHPLSLPFLRPCLLFSLLHTRSTPSNLSLLKRTEIRTSFLNCKQQQEAIIYSFKAKAIILDLTRHYHMTDLELLGIHYYALFSIMFISSEFCQKTPQHFAWKFANLVRINNGRGHSPKHFVLPRHFQKFFKKLLQGYIITVDPYQLNADPDPWSASWKKQAWGAA